jgi:hypothetical protein
MSAGTAVQEVVTADSGFGREILRLRTRSGFEYGLSGDAPRFVHYVQFLTIAVLTLLGMLFAESLDLCSASFLFDWYENLKALAVLAVCVLLGYAVSAGVVHWAFHHWLKRNEFVVYEHGLRAQFPDLEIAVPFSEVIEVWLCEQAACRHEDKCDARRSGAAISKSVIQVMESMLSWYLAILTTLITIPSVLLGGGGVPRPPNREAAAKLFLTLRGGVEHSLGRYLRRFRKDDRGRAIKELQSRLPGAFKSHQANKTLA